MHDWPAWLIEAGSELEGAALGDGTFGAGPAIWVGKREIAHLDDPTRLDLRLTKEQIRARRAELEADVRISLRKRGSDWLELRLRDADDVEFALGLLRDAVAANLATAPPGRPPTGADLDRRRRFH